jgi:hypothetical protein
VEDFKPFSFRAGNWLFQPTKTVANVLAEWGVKVDSSVFKGGLQHKHKLDYREALRNGYYWTFTNKVDIPDNEGDMLEFPIYTQMVPSWKMLTKKRIGLQQKGSLGDQNGKRRSDCLLDYLRLWYPLKFDFCRMTIDELKKMLDTIIHEDRQDPTSFRPIVAIGHTKDLVDLETVEKFLDYLQRKGIPVSTFKEIFDKCKQ